MSKYLDIKEMYKRNMRIQLILVVGLLAIFTAIISNQNNTIAALTSHLGEKSYILVHTKSLGQKIIPNKLDDQYIKDEIKSVVESYYNVGPDNIRAAYEQLVKTSSNSFRNEFKTILEKKHSIIGLKGLTERIKDHEIHFSVKANYSVEVKVSSIIEVLLGAEVVSEKKRVLEYTYTMSVDESTFQLEITKFREMGELEYQKLEVKK